MEYPKITIITSIYKRRETVKDTIKSVCSQTYPSIQYIIVDDGPQSVDDEIADFIHSLNDGIDVKIIRNDSNRGTSYSLNRAVGESEGEYIFNISDDDCFSDDNVIMDWVSEFIKTGADVITAKRAVYDITMTNMEGIEPSDSVAEKIKTMSCKELFDEMSGYNYIFGCVTAKRKSLFDKPYGRYNEKYRIIEDYSSNMILLRNNVTILFFDRVVINYRKGGISSAEQINKTYLKESDEIFRKEILPYVSSKLKAIRRYRKWKKDVLSFKKNNNSH